MQYVEDLATKSPGSFSVASYASKLDIVIVTNLIPDLTLFPIFSVSQTSVFSVMFRVKHNNISA